MKLYVNSFLLAAMMFATAIFTAGQVATGSGNSPETLSVAHGAPDVTDWKQSETAPEGQRQTWNLHVQSTAILQGYPGLRARYSGANSLPPSGEVRDTVSVDIYGGYRLWNGAEAHIDLLTWQGFGLRGTVGIDDFPNGEAYKVGTHAPHLDVARFYIRQTIGLGGERENILDGQQTLAGQQDVSRLTFTIGRFSSKDSFDNNTYANDPRKQFMNWALVANMAWDYPADSLGYTTGVTVELNQPKWTLRYGFFQLPKQRNSFTAEAQFLVIPGDDTAGDGRFWHAWGMVVENERRYSINAHPGAIRILGYVNQADMGSYQAALSAPGTNIDLTHALRHEYGFGLNWEQEITKNIGMFSRMGWNDGHNEAWMFSDVNHTASLGMSVKGERWRRRDDTFGLAGVISGISSINQKFLAAGGAGILDGDGALNYGAEKVLETYYDYKISKHIHGALDYQFVANPAFNRARGPVSVFGARLHWEF
jgi:high affinity Mn2+ porin